MRAGGPGINTTARPPLQTWVAATGATGSSTSSSSSGSDWTAASALATESWGQQRPQPYARGPAPAPAMAATHAAVPVAQGVARTAVRSLTPARTVSFHVPATAQRGGPSISGPGTARGLGFTADSLAVSGRDGLATAAAQWETSFARQTSHASIRTAEDHPAAVTAAAGMAAAQAARVAHTTALATSPDTSPRFAFSRHASASAVSASNAPASDTFAHGALAAGAGAGGAALDPHAASGTGGGLRMLRSVKSGVTEGSGSAYSIRSAGLEAAVAPGTAARAPASPLASELAGGEGPAVTITERGGGGGEADADAAPRRVARGRSPKRLTGPTSALSPSE
jgi:hypothetical protein